MIKRRPLICNPKPAHRTSFALFLSVLPFFISCSSVKREIREEVRTRRVIDARTTESGSGVRFSSILENIPPDASLKAEDISFFDEFERALAVNPGSRPLPLRCRVLSGAPEACRFLKPKWYARWLQSEDALEGPTAPNLKVEQERPKKRRRRAQAPVIEQIAQKLEAGEYAPVAKQRPGDYYRALKTFPGITEGLKTVESKILEPGVCAPSELYNFLGLKSEEQMPEEEFRERAIRLYARADQCAEATKYTDNSRFRLALLSIIKKDCATAATPLQRLSNAVMNDYSSRARYWTAWCARETKDKNAFFDNYDALFQMNPLGFHTLSLSDGDSVLSGNLGQEIDPLVQTRSALDDRVNPWIQAMEEMTRRKRKDLVLKLLTPIQPRLEELSQLEPGVRLYLASFAYRAGNPVALFRLLDSVFRSKAEYVVDKTLQLFYPLEFFDLVLKHAGRMNPILVASLIRQESAFRANARSPVGAVGLMQLMPATARTMQRGVSKRQLLDADTNIRLGIQYFQMLVNRFDGDVELALASYNAGPEAVDRWRARYPVGNRMLFLDLIPYAETRNYVTLIGRNYFWYHRLYRKLILEKFGVASITPAEFSAFGAL